MRTRPSTLALAALAVASIAAAPATADGPDSESGASAVQVQDVATISGTQASTGDGGSASSTVVGVGGETVVGGSQEGEGSQSGEIVGTGETDNGQATVGGWSADVEDDRSSSEASVLDARQNEEDGLAVTALRSRSEATKDGGSSASSTGARVSGGGNSLTVLHSEANSNGEGGSYLVGINDETRIGTSEDANGECKVEADPLADVLCLYAGATSGDGEGEDGSGDASTGYGAGVVDSELLDGATGLDLINAETGEVPAGDGSGDATPPAGDPDDGTGDDSTPPAGDTPFTPAADPSGELPRTGGGIATSLLGLLGIGGAAALKRFGS